MQVATSVPWSFTTPSLHMEIINADHGWRHSRENNLYRVLGLGTPAATYRTWRTLESWYHGDCGRIQNLVQQVLYI